MPRKSAISDPVRRSAGEVPPAAPEHLAHLLTAMDGPIDTSDVPEAKGPAPPIRRDDSGRVLRTAPSPIRRALLDALARRGMTRYQLWAEARKSCPTLSQSAVYEYMRGQRAISSPYVEALLKAAGLVVKPSQAVRPGKLSKAPAKVSAG